MYWGDGEDKEVGREERERETFEQHVAISFSRVRTNLPGQSPVLLPI
jgi:hypothetical protein